MEHISKVIKIESQPITIIHRKQKQEFSVKNHLPKLIGLFSEWKYSLSLLVAQNQWLKKILKCREYAFKVPSRVPVTLPLSCGQ